MPAYFIASYKITNPGVYWNEYIPKVMPLVIKHQGEPIVVDQEVAALEGNPQHYIVVIKFPSRDAAESWFQDPDYKPVAAIRHGATENGWATISDHFVPPQ